MQFENKLLGRRRGQMSARPTFIILIGALIFLGCRASTTPVVDSAAEPVAASPAEPITEPTKWDDLQLLQGTWEQTVPSFARGTTITISGKKKTVRSGEQVVVDNVIIEIDATADPKIWDEHPGDQPDVVFRGVYKLEGDVLTRCFASQDEPRPTGFRSASTPNTGGATAVFERVKPSNAEGH
jgi:uncharacterized protein (TIGR03067 family)